MSPGASSHSRCSSGLLARSLTAWRACGAEEERDLARSWLAGVPGARWQEAVAQAARAGALATVSTPQAISVGLACAEEAVEEGGRHGRRGTCTLRPSGSHLQLLGGQAGDLREALRPATGDGRVGQGKEGLSWPWPEAMRTSAPKAWASHRPTTTTSTAVCRACGPRLGFLDHAVVVEECQVALQTESRRWLDLNARRDRRPRT